MKPRGFCKILHCIDWIEFLGETRNSKKSLYASPLNKYSPLSIADKQRRTQTTLFIFHRFGSHLL